MERNPLLSSNPKPNNNGSTEDTSTSPSMMIPNATTNPPSEIVSYASPRSVNRSPAQVLQSNSINTTTANSQNSNTSQPQEFILKREPTSQSQISQSRDRTAMRYTAPSRSRIRSSSHNSYSGGRSNTVPLTSSFLFIVIAFGIIFVLCIDAASIYFIMSSENDTIDGGGDNSSYHGDLSNIMLPLIVYLLNVVLCCLVYLEARHFRMRGYSLMFVEVSKRSKLSFRFTSLYFTLCFAAYSFLVHHAQRHVQPQQYFLTMHELDVVFVGIWSFVYLFIIGTYIQFSMFFYLHNRDRPKPDLFDGLDMASNVASNRTDHSRQSVNGPDTEVIQRLYSDKSTLMRQQEAMTVKYEQSQRELMQLQSDTASSLMDSQFIMDSIGGSMESTKDNGETMRMQIQRLRARLQSEKEQSRTFATQIETKKTMLDSQIAETEQLRNVLQAKEERISQLMNDKESLEREVQAANDQKDDLSLLYQVKEQEVEIAKKENERLRNKLQSMLSGRSKS